MTWRSILDYTTWPDPHAIECNTNRQQRHMMLLALHWQLLARRWCLSVDKAAICSGSTQANSVCNNYANSILCTASSFVHSPELTAAMRPGGYLITLLLLVTAQHEGPELDSFRTKTQLKTAIALSLDWTWPELMTGKQQQHCEPAYQCNNNQTACQPGLGACGARLSSPGRLVLSILIGAGNIQMVNVRQDHIVPHQHIAMQQYVEFTARLVHGHT